MTKTALLAVATVLLGSLALPTWASARSRCQPRAQERVLRASAQAVLLGQRGRVIGCSKATGHRRLLYKPYEHAEFSWLRHLQLVGTVVVLIDTTGSHYGYGVDQLSVDDAIHRGRHHFLTGVAWPEAIEQPMARENGTVAWIVRHEGDHEVQVRRTGDEQRTLDTGFAISDLRLTDTSVSWRHGHQPRSWSLASASACAMLPSRGTADVDVREGAGRTQACLRATGHTIEVPARLDHLSTAGSEVAYSHDDAITVLDLAADRAVDVAAPGAWSIAVDEHGSLVWLADDVSGGGTALWAHDAHGTREVDVLRFGLWFGRDGSTIRWPTPSGDATLTLAAS